METNDDIWNPALVMPNNNNWDISFVSKKQTLESSPEFD